MISGSTGIERLARKMGERAEKLSIPDLHREPDTVVDPIEFAAAAGFDELDEWQVRALTSESRKLLMLCSRQSGKSTVASLLVAHGAAHTPNGLYLVGSPSLRQSGEQFRGFRNIYRAAQAHLDIPEIVMESALRAELSNGARVISLPASEGTVRGYSGATMLVLDEAARILDEMMASLRPTLATTGGKIVALSTPHGRSGWFYLEWANGEGWHREAVRAEDCPRINPEFLDDELRSLGPLRYSQEYECRFTEDTETMFDPDLISEAFYPGLQPLWPEFAMGGVS